MSRTAPMRYLALVFALLAFGCGEKQEEPSFGAASTDKPATPAGPTGRIRGVVRLQGPAPKPAFEPITADQNICGDKVTLPRLALGKDNGVQHAFVYLDDVPSTQEYRPQQSVLIDQKDCQYIPRAMAIAPGAQIEVTNSDPILHNVNARIPTEDGLQTVFNFAQPKRGMRTSVGSLLTKPGIVVLSCEAGHPWMSAYMFVANHPFVAVTGDDGNFVIENVPVGKYRIKMWHEGVTMKRNLKALQRYEYEEPYETTLDVVVEAGGEAVVNFDLTLRPAA